jgi:hypothetical protein
MQDLLGKEPRTDCAGRAWRHAQAPHANPFSLDSTQNPAGSRDSADLGCTNAKHNVELASAVQLTNDAGFVCGNICARGNQAVGDLSELSADSPRAYLQGQQMKGPNGAPNERRGHRPADAAGRRHRRPAVLPAPAATPALAAPPQPQSPR